MFRRFEQQGVSCRVPVAVRVPATPRATVLFLHGSGERGDDGVRQTTVGLGPMLAAHDAMRDALVVLPQAPADDVWLGDVAETALAAAEAARVRFAATATPLVVTGLSLGGYGALHLAAAHPGHFAACVAVCGGVRRPAGGSVVRQSPLATGDDPYVCLARRIGPSTPVWLAHGADDPVIPAHESREMARALASCGAMHLHHVEYPGIGHAVWDTAYGDPALWVWLAEQLS